MRVSGETAGTEAAGAGALRRGAAAEGTAAVIFDMDGVLVDSEPLHEQVFLEIFRDMGYGETHGVDFAAHYGRTDRAVWEDFVARHRIEVPVDELIGRKQRRLVQLLREREPVYPGVMELLPVLAARYRLAVASGSLHAVIAEALALRGMRRFFQRVVSVQDVPRPKPFPDVFLRAAAELGVPPDQCCVIEDSPAGTQAAVAAGMRVIGVTHTVPAERLSQAQWVVEGYPGIALLFDRPADVPAAGPLTA